MLVGTDCQFLIGENLAVGALVAVANFVQPRASGGLRDVVGYIDVRDQEHDSVGHLVGIECEFQGASGCLHIHGFRLHGTGEQNLVPAIGRGVGLEVERVGRERGTRNQSENDERANHGNLLVCFAACGFAIEIDNDIANPQAVGGQRLSASRIRSKSSFESNAITIWPLSLDFTLISTRTASR